MRHKGVTLPLLVNDTYAIYVTKLGTQVYYREEVRTNNTTVTRSKTMATTNGQEYIIQVFTDPDSMFDSSQAMDVNVKVQ